MSRAPVLPIVVTVIVARQLFAARRLEERFAEKREESLRRLRPQAHGRKAAA